MESINHTAIVSIPVVQWTSVTSPTGTLCHVCCCSLTAIKINTILLSRFSTLKTH